MPYLHKPAGFFDELWDLGCRLRKGSTSVQEELRLPSWLKEGVGGSEDQFSTAGIIAIGVITWIII